jgi:hypothetical protein
VFNHKKEQEKPMSDRRRVYTKVLKTLKEMLKMVHQGHIVTIAMMITGIVMSRKAQLSVMSEEIPAKEKIGSVEMRMRRLVKNERIDVETVYMPFAEQIIRALAPQPLVLVMDGSQVGRGHMVLMVGVMYKSRALPLAWVVYKGKKGHTTAERHIEALVKTKALVPEDVEVILLGDGEYDTTDMLEWVQTQTTWQYVVRTGSNLLIERHNVWHKIVDFANEPGQLRMLHEIVFTQTGTFPTNLVIWWGKGYQDPIFLVSDLPNASQAARYYKRRFTIETFFSDQKSRGFHIHKSHLADAQRISRLLIAACLAYIWMIGLGLFTLSTGKQKLIDRPDRIDKSVFRLGLDWLKYALKHELDFPVLFHFEPL